MAKVTNGVETFIGVASYGALGHVPPRLKQLI